VLLITYLLSPPLAAAQNINSEVTNLNNDNIINSFLQVLVKFFEFVIQTPYLYIPLTAIILLIILRTTLFYTLHRLNQATNSIFFFVGDLNKGASSLGKLAGSFRTVAHHPTFRRLFGLVSPTFVILRLNPPKMKKIRTIIRRPPPIYAKMEKRFYKTMDNEAKMGEAIFGSEECMDHVQKEIRRWVEVTDLLIIICSGQGGHGAFLSKGYLRIIKSTTKASKIILILVESAPAKDVQRMNMEVAMAHSYHIQFADLVIIVKQHDVEKDSVNNMLGKLLLAIGSQKVEGQDFADFLARLPSKFVYLMRLPNLSSHATAGPKEVEYDLEFIKNKDPDALRECLFLKEASVEIKGKKVGLLVIEPEGIRRIEMLTGEIADNLSCTVEASMGIEWDRNSVEAFLLVPFTNPELQQTEVGICLATSALLTNYGSGNKNGAER